MSDTSPDWPGGSPGEEDASEAKSGLRFDPLKAALLLSLASATAVLCVLLATTVVALRSGTRAIDRLGENLTLPQPTAQLSTASVVVRSLTGASELATTVFTLDTIVDESRDRVIGPLTVGNTRLLYVAHGQVKAGVDLSLLTADDVSVGDTKVTVTLAAPRILDAKIDVDKSYVYDLDRSLLGPVDPDLQTRAERYALREIVGAACESGILTDANDRAEVAVEALLEPLLDLPVEVVTSAPAEASCGAEYN